ncbi:MAG: transposase [Chloroflexi bacterium]|nr:transposase [Chloroflexota bacterium]
MPVERRAEWARLFELNPSPDKQKQIQQYLDQGRGSCLLRNAAAGSLVEQALLYSDTVRYYLLAWVIMPNHVHVAVSITPDWTIARIVQDWKRISARVINVKLRRSGTLWQRDYFDRFIRNETHLTRVVSYIHANPVLAHLVDNPSDWPFSSARLVDTPESTYKQRWPIL